MLGRTMLHIPIAMFATAVALSAQAPAAPAGQAAPAARPRNSTDGAFHAGLFRWRRDSEPPHASAQAERGISPRSSGPTRPQRRRASCCTCATRKSRAIGRPTIRCTGWSGTFRAPKKDCRKGCPKGRSCRTASARSAPAARCIADQARRQPARCITTPSRSMRSTRRSTCRRRRRVGDAPQSLQGDGRPRDRQGRDGRIVQATAVEVARSRDRVGRRSKHHVLAATICYNRCS